MMIQPRRCYTALSAFCVTVLTTQEFAATGFTALTTPSSSSQRQPLHLQHQHNGGRRQPTSSLFMSATASMDSFFDDFNPRRRIGKQSSGGGGGSTDNGDEPSSTNTFGVQQESWFAERNKFATGDELHRLRHRVMAMRLELQEARRNGSLERIQELERAIMKTQQVDAEFVYTVSLERRELALQEGRLVDAENYNDRAKEARAALPQFQLEGLWVGKYGEHGYEMINVTYAGDFLMAHKVTGTKNVPRGQATFQVNLNPHCTASPSSASGNGHPELLSPIELGESAAQQWGCKYLQRFAGQGQVAAENYMDSQWIDGQLILVNEYFSFAWLPIGHQVFFGRPTPELVLKLMREEERKESGECDDRSFLEKCWQETEHVQDDMEVSSGIVHDGSVPGEYYTSDTALYHQEGCFE